MATNQIIFLAILVLTLILLITERIRKDLVSLMVILSLYVTGLLTSSEALSGFSSEPAIIVAAVFVMSSAFRQTGLTDIMGAWIGRVAGDGYSRMILVIMPSVAIMAAFTHHLTITAIMIPIVMGLAREKGVPASKLLMPMSLAASLGTTMTIIGAPAFLVANDTLRRGGSPILGFFDMAPIGLALCIAATLYIMLFGRYLIPAYEGVEDTTNLFKLDKYLTEIVIRPNSPFEGKSLAEVKSSGQYHFTVIGWMREGLHLRGPFQKLSLQAGDILLVHTTPEDIVAFHEEAGVELHPVEKYGEQLKKQIIGESPKDSGDSLVQAIVSPGSDLIGRTIGEIDFRKRYGSLVVGLWRQSGWLEMEISKSQLQEGDVLLLLSDEDSLVRIANDKNFLMLVPFQGERRLRQRARRAGLIMLVMVLAAAAKVLPLEMAALAGAAAMILTGCITARQAYRGVDIQIYIFIAGAIPLGAAMEKTGTATLMAGWMQGSFSGLNESLILAILFCIVSLITQVMSDAATTAVFAPVAFALAKALGQAPEPYVVTVAVASVAAFLTPIGHHGNLLIYGPGRYRFIDFVKVGTPLTILIGILVCLLAPLIWHS